ncbi:hypothetical protein D7Z54_35125, partial [Salibacterium salarium]
IFVSMLKNKPKRMRTFNRFYFIVSLSVSTLIWQEEDWSSAGVALFLFTSLYFSAYWLIQNICAKETHSLFSYTVCKYTAFINCRCVGKQSFI